jgi:hypothetical protein
MARASDDDMTGSALVKLMEASFRRQRLNLPRLKIRKDGAHASLTDKVTVAETVLRLYGPGPLLNVGASISEMARDPLGAALLCAPSGRSLFDRWQRLERYVHTRHPIVMFDVTDSTARLDHQGDLDDPPSVAINFVLAGLFAHLLLAIGCQHVKLAIGHKKQAVPIELDLFNGCAATPAFGTTTRRKRLNTRCFRGWMQQQAIKLAGNYPANFTNLSNTIFYIFGRSRKRQPYSRSHSAHCSVG